MFQGEQIDPADEYFFRFARTEEEGFGQAVLHLVTTSNAGTFAEAEETALLQVLDAVLAAPGDAEHYNRLREATKNDPLGKRHSAAVETRCLAIAARRAELHRDVHFYLTGALDGVSDPGAIAYMLDLLAEPGLSLHATDALKHLEPAVVAGPLREWLKTRDVDALPNAYLLSHLRAILDLAVPPADPSTATPVTPEMLEIWIQELDLAALRLALAGGSDANTPISNGETLLHCAVAGWIDANEDSDGPPRSIWEQTVELLLSRGADPERKLKRWFEAGGRGWKPGTTPRGMLALEHGGDMDEDLARIEALFPAPAKKTRAAKPKAPKPKLLQDLKSSINSCADDVFEHQIRVSAVRYEGGKFVVDFDDLTSGIDDSADLEWQEPLDTSEQTSALQLALIDCIAGSVED